MIIKDISFDCPRRNILFDEVLLYLAEKKEGQEVLRFWESPSYFVVLGRIGKLEDDVHLKEIRTDQIPVLRRSSGGGTVLQGPGCLNYSLVLSKDTDKAVSDLRRSYDFILGKVVHALAGLGVKAKYYPISDIALDGSQKKFSGNAQKRGRQFILHHGTVLYNFDLPRISKYLTMPKGIPEYRHARTHKDFVTNIGKDASSIKARIAEAFGAVQRQGLEPLEEEVLREFLETKVVTVAV